MKITEYGDREDKTKVEVCRLLRTLCEQLLTITQTVKDIELTLYNEEYEK